jgi:uncharacterized protein YdhG (YjbR/CyaY superfamily)
MVSSEAATVEEYLAELPPERREVIAEVREKILENLPPGYAETMNWGMISYEIPLEDYPNTYNGQPLNYVALAAQKNHYAVYMNGVYQDSKQEEILREGFEKIGVKPDMGKSCVRFRKLENIPLDVIGELVASTSPENLIMLYKESRKK